MSEKGFGKLGASFQQTLIKYIIEDKKYGEAIIDVIEPKYFDNNSFRFIIQIIKEFYKKYNTLPNYETLRQKVISETTTDDIAKIHLDTITGIFESVGQEDHIKEESLNFCRQQNLKKELKRVEKIIENGAFQEYNKIEEIVTKALQVGLETNAAVDVFYDLDAVLEKDNRRPITTGISGLDNMIKGGIGRGELGVILAPTGIGKSQPISEPILTPFGWKIIGNIKVGDEVIGSNGKSQHVLGVYPQGIRPIYKIVFTDDTFVYCDEEHLWSVNTLNMRTAKTRVKGNAVYVPDFGYKVMKTIDMTKDIKKRKRYNYRLPIISPVEFDKKEVLIDPYLLGLLLGDGHLCRQNPTISTKDDELFYNIKDLNEHTAFTEYTRTNTKTIKVIRLKTIISERLKKYNLSEKKSNSKFIPTDYLYNSLDNRILLLQGLMDTDGYISKKGTIQYSTASKELFENVRELVLSLGGTVKIGTKIPKYTYKGERKIGQLSYILTISFANDIVPFKLLRKVDRYFKRFKYIEQKFIKTITYSHEEESICIKVSNPDELYVTRDYILTHNTTILTKFAASAYMSDFNVLHIIFEDTLYNIQRKHLTVFTGISPDEQPNKKEEVKQIKNDIVKRCKGTLDIMKLSSDSVTISELKSKVRKHVSDGHKIDLLVVDYVDCILPDRIIFGDEWKGEGAIMRHLESMAAEFDIGVWVGTQGNRSSMSTDIVTSDQTGGSIKKMQVGHIILSIAKSLTQKENNLATMTLCKSRIGKDGTIWPDCKFDNEFLIIDTAEQTTLLGHQVEKEKETAIRIKEAFERKQNLTNRE